MQAAARAKAARGQDAPLRRRPCGMRRRALFLFLRADGEQHIDVEKLLLDVDVHRSAVFFADAAHAFQAEAVQLRLLFGRFRQAFYKFDRSFAAVIVDRRRHEPVHRLLYPQAHRALFFRLLHGCLDGVVEQVAEHDVDIFFTHKVEQLAVRHITDADIAALAGAVVFRQRDVERGIARKREGGVVCDGALHILCRRLRKHIVTAEETDLMLEVVALDVDDLHGLFDGGIPLALLPADDAQQPQLRKQPPAEQHFKLQNQAEDAADDIIDARDDDAGQRIQIIDDEGVEHDVEYQQEADEEKAEHGREEKLLLAEPDAERPERDTVDEEYDEIVPDSQKRHGKHGRKLAAVHAAVQHRRVAAGKEDERNVVDLIGQVLHRISRDAAKREFEPLFAEDELRHAHGENKEGKKHEGQVGGRRGEDGDEPRKEKAGRNGKDRAQQAEPAPLQRKEKDRLRQQKL